MNPWDNQMAKIGGYQLPKQEPIDYKMKSFTDAGTRAGLGR